jgi:S-formylglutathione hydrolase FrmB
MLEGVEMKESRLLNLLNAEWQRALKLACMQMEIEDGDFDSAMGYQFEYLYWHDELDRLFPKHSAEYWSLRMVAGG